MRNKNWTLSCAESCTGGGVAYAITSVAGSSAWFKQSYVTYSNEAKQQLLQVSPHTLDTFGAVSAETVAAMAKGCAAQSNAEAAVAISGIAGPDGGSPEKPVGTVWFGFIMGQDSKTEVQCFDGDRSEVRCQAIDYALNRLCELITD